MGDFTPCPCNRVKVFTPGLGDFLTDYSLCPESCPVKLFEDAIPAEACMNELGIYYRPSTDIILEEDYVLVIKDPSRSKNETIE